MAGRLCFNLDSPLLFWERQLEMWYGKAYGRVIDKLFIRRSGNGAYIYHDIKLHLLLFGMQAQYICFQCGRRICVRTWAVVFLFRDVEFEEYLELMSSGVHRMNTQA